MYNGKEWSYSEKEKKEKRKVRIILSENVYEELKTLAHMEELDTEIGMFGVTEINSKGNIVIKDLRYPEQETTRVNIKIDHERMAQFKKENKRIYKKLLTYIHMHPGNGTPSPSYTDHNETFENMMEVKRFYVFIIFQRHGAGVGLWGQINIKEINGVKCDVIIEDSDIEFAIDVKINSEIRKKCLKIIQNKLNPETEEEIPETPMANYEKEIKLTDYGKSIGVMPTFSDINKLCESDKTFPMKPLILKDGRIYFLCKDIPKLKELLEKKIREWKMLIENYESGTYVYGKNKMTELIMSTKNPKSHPSKIIKLLEGVMIKYEDENDDKLAEEYEKSVEEEIKNIKAFQDDELLDEYGRYKWDKHNY